MAVIYNLQTYHFSTEFFPQGTHKDGIFQQLGIDWNLRIYRNFPRKVQL